MLILKESELKEEKEVNMKQIVVKVLANTLILFILTYVVDHLTHHNSNYWNIIPETVNSFV